MAHAAISLPPGYRLARHEMLESTNAEALRVAGQGEAEGLWVWARSQSNGRGRLGRKWQSLDGNLFASLLLRPDCDAATAAQAGFVAGLAMHDVVSELAGQSSGMSLVLKWPNDLLLAEKKAGGILLESVESETGRAVVMGLGLNLAAHPQDTDYPATSLADHAIDATPANALEVLATACDRWLAAWDEGRGFEGIRRAWLERSMPPGAPLEIRLAHDRIRGRFAGLDASGALCITLPDGSDQTVTTGDMFPL